jgi:hypothetical protein
MVLFSQQQGVWISALVRQVQLQRAVINELSGTLQQQPSATSPHPTDDLNG